MDLLLWITVGFIVAGFVVLVSMKKSMEMKVALIMENGEGWRVNRFQINASFGG